MIRGFARKRRIVNELRTAATQGVVSFSEIDDDLERGLANIPFGSAALVVVAGDQTHSVVLGNAAKRLPATTSTPFHICSCSKTFTAAVFSRLVADGAICWDDPVRLLLPEFTFSDAWVSEHCTFRDLAAMRVGLTRDGIAEWGFRQNVPKAERLRRARCMELTSPFRSGFSYSNLCYIGLALAAERVADEPYSELLRQLIFAPLNFHDSWSEGGDVAEKKNKPAQPNVLIDGELTPVNELTGPNSEGSARVYLSPKDAAVWMRFLLAAYNGSDAGPLSSATVKEMASPQSILRGPGIHDSPERGWSSYGHGLFITNFLGEPLLRHGGGGRGLRHSMALAPRHDIGVMLMVTSESVGVDGLALELLERLLTGKTRDWRTQFAENSEATAAAERRSVEEKFSTIPAGMTVVDFREGDYCNDVTGVVRLTRKNDKLRFAPVDAPIFAASLRRLKDGTYELEFDEPALSRQPLDPLFRVRFQVDATATTLSTSYFGELREVH